MLDLLLIEWVTKMKPGGNSVKDHPQLRHPVDGALVGAGSLWPLMSPCKPFECCVSIRIRYRYQPVINPGIYSLT